jgi:hypothetical protein
MRLPEEERMRQARIRRSMTREERIEWEHRNASAWREVKREADAAPWKVAKRRAERREKWIAAAVALGIYVAAVLVAAWMGAGSESYSGGLILIFFAALLLPLWHSIGVIIMCLVEGYWIALTGIVFLWGGIVVIAALIEWLF